MSDTLSDRLRQMVGDTNEELDTLWEAADEIERLLANAKQDAEYLAAYHYWCQKHGCAPSYSDLIASREAYISVRTKLGEKKDE